MAVHSALARFVDAAARGVAAERGARAPGASVIKGKTSSATTRMVQRDFAGLEGVM
jgi:hypothetical protein